MITAAIPWRSAGEIARGRPMNVGMSSSMSGKNRVRAKFELRMSAQSG